MEQIKHPTKQQVQIVIDNLIKVLLWATRKDHLDMDEAKVNINYECRTIHCLGGWYAIATCDLKEERDYNDGTNRMARDLGFKNVYYLPLWASQNPKIWGNKYGGIIFSHKSSFESLTRPNGAENLTDIINHLQEVKERLPI